MLRSLGQAPIYLIVDALDECPNTSKAPNSLRSRQEVLEVVKELVNLRLQTLHICVTSRPEFDIAEYVHSVVYSDKESVMMK